MDQHPHRTRPRRVAVAVLAVLAVTLLTSTGALGCGSNCDTAAGVRDFVGYGSANDFEYSTPVQTLVNVGLTDLPATLPDAERYTYLYQGNSQVLDHIMLSAPLISAGYGYDIVHVNSEFPTPLSDHEPQVTRLTL